MKRVSSSTNFTQLPYSPTQTFPTICSCAVLLCVRKPGIVQLGGKDHFASCRRPPAQPGKEVCLRHARQVCVYRNQRRHDSVDMHGGDEMGMEGCARHVWTCLFESRFQKSDIRERTAASAVGGIFTCRQQNIQMKSTLRQRMVMWTLG